MTRGLSLVMYLWISLMFHSKVKKGTESHFLKTGNFVETFRDWCSRSCPHLNTAKSKEIVMANGRSRPFQSSVSIHGQDTEVVYCYKYLRVLLKDKLDWAQEYWFSSQEGAVPPRLLAAAEVFWCVMRYWRCIWSYCGGQCSVLMLLCVGAQLNGQKH